MTSLVDMLREIKESVEVVNDLVGDRNMDHIIEKIDKAIAAAEKLEPNRVVWPNGKIETARKDLALLYDPRSMCYNDGIYAKSLVDKYGMSVSELENIVGKPVFETTLKWDTGEPPSPRKR